MSKKQLIKGTVILTIAGILTRFIGFFYKIYLSNSIGASNLGLYSLIFPVYVICHTIYASGLQTALSKNIAANTSNLDLNHKNNTKINLLCHCILIGTLLSLSLSILVYANAGFIAKRILLEPSCKRYIKLMSFAFPFCALTSNINGYYYGLKQTKIPAINQLLEQSSRFIIVFFIVYFNVIDFYNGCILAVIGLVVGELFSCLYTIFSFKEKITFVFSFKHMKSLIYPATLLTLNRLLINILSSIESILIPSMLRKYGLTSNTSLSIYGTLFGMSLPIILFPSAISTALSIMLLPEVSKDYSLANKKRISSITEKIIVLSGVIGIFFFMFFYIWGNDIGYLFFSSHLAGRFIHKLAILCPLMYLSNSFYSILNGLDKSFSLLLHTVTGLCIRIAILILLVPNQGIDYYIYGVIISNVILCILNYIDINSYTRCHINLIDSIVYPLLCSYTILITFKKLYALLSDTLHLQRAYSLILLFTLLGLSCIIYLLTIIVRKSYHSIIQLYR